MIIEYLDMFFSGGSLAVVTLVLYRQHVLEKSVESHDDRQRELQSDVDEIAGRTKILERLAFSGDAAQES